VKTVRNMNIAVIGAGRHASANLHPAITLAGASIACVLTRSISSAEIAAKSLGADRYYDDIEVMLGSEKLDAVVISVEPEDQEALTIRCLHGGVAVFVEKPLGITAVDARRVLAASDKYNVPVMVAFMKRYAPAYQRLTELISNEKDFGRILSIDASFSFAPWTTDLRDDTFLQQGAIHMVDFLRATFGEVTVVSGISNSQKSDIGLVYSLKFSNGPIASVNMTASQSRSSTNERVTVVGTKAWAEAVNLKSVRYGFAGQDFVQSEPWDSNLSDRSLTSHALELHEQGFYGEVSHFLECVAAGNAPTPSASENVETMVLCDELIRSVK
jgi:UDP-N-acetylglucosamine 3-dehydrogenase